MQLVVELVGKEEKSDDSFTVEVVVLGGVEEDFLLESVEQVELAVDRAREEDVGLFGVELYFVDATLHLHLALIPFALIQSHQVDHPSMRATTHVTILSHAHAHSQHQSTRIPLH